MESYCPAGAILPDHPELIRRHVVGSPCESSCRGNCGKVMNMTAGLNYFSCSCDALCRVYNDCCGDLEHQCPSEHLRGIEIMRHYRINSSSLQAQCESPTGDITMSTPLISSCNSDVNACVTGEQYPFDEIPVTDLDTNVNFINAGCAICNGVTRGKVWETDLKCEIEIDSNWTMWIKPKHAATRKIIIESSYISTSDTLLSLLSLNECYLQIDSPLQHFL